MADFSGRNSTSDNGEMQISPDGRYLIVTNRQNVQAYGGQPDTQLRLYRIVGPTGGLELVSTFMAPNATISSLDFSPQNGYLYYIATTGNSAETPNTIQHRLRRLSLPGLTNPQNVLNGATEVRRTVQGHLLVTRGQEVRTLSAPNAPTVPAVLASMATNYTWSGGPNNPLQTNVALQPIITHAEQGVAHRHLGRKHYELTDHLGNVRVVVSDVKLSSLNVNNEPHTFLAQVVSRTDYYAFGSLLPGRNYGSDEYDYGFNGMPKDDEIHGAAASCDFGGRLYSSQTGRWFSVDPMEQQFPEWSSYHFSFDNPMLFVDPDGESPISVLAKYLAKRGLKEGLKKYTEKQIKGRLQKYMTKGMTKQLGKDIEKILGELDSEPWEMAIELIPGVGDIYGATKFGQKLVKAYARLQDLENSYVEKVAKALNAKDRKKFVDRMRDKGVNDARIDQKSGVNVKGIQYEKNKGVDGHHLENVKDDNSKMTDPHNIEFMKREDHIKIHKKPESPPARRGRREGPSFNTDKE